jgi:hypothetical protein
MPSSDLPNGVEGMEICCQTKMSQQAHMERGSTLRSPRPLTPCRQGTVMSDAVPPTLHNTATRTDTYTHGCRQFTDLLVCNFKPKSIIWHTGENAPPARHRATPILSRVQRTNNVQRFANTTTKGDPRRWTSATMLLITRSEPNKIHHPNKKREIQAKKAEKGQTQSNPRCQCAHS